MYIENLKGKKILLLNLRKKDIWWLGWKRKEMVETRSGKRRALELLVGCVMSWQQAQGFKWLQTAAGFLCVWKCFSQIDTSSASVITWKQGWWRLPIGTTEESKNIYLNLSLKKDVHMSFWARHLLIWLQGTGEVQPTVLRRGGQKFWWRALLTPTANTPDWEKDRRGRRGWLLMTGGVGVDFGWGLKSWGQYSLAPVGFIAQP